MLLTPRLHNRSDRIDVKPENGAEAVNSTIAAAQTADAQLGEAASFNTVNPEHPLKRSLVVSVKASLNDLCLVSTLAERACGLMGAAGSNRAHCVCVCAGSASSARRGRPPRRPCARSSSSRCGGPRRDRIYVH